MATIQGIFVALFNRPADPLGLAFYSDPANAGSADAIGDLSGTPEYLARFKGLVGDNAAIVTTIYSDLLGHNPDEAGLKFYTDRLASGEFTINDVAIRILDGATGDDADVVANKLVAADAFTAALDTPDEIAAYNGSLNEFAIPLGADFLSGITSDDATIPTAAQVDAAVQGIVDQGENPQVPGQTFSLKAAVGEIVDGTSGNDTFSGVLPDTFNVGDQLDGKGGDADVLNLFVTAAAGLPAGSIVKGIEIVNLVSSGGFVVTGPVDASFFQGSTQLWQVDAASDVENASQTIGFRGGAAAFANTVEFDQAAGSLAFDSVVSGTTITVDGPSATTKLASVTAGGSVDSAGGGVPGMVTVVEGADAAVKGVTLNFTSAVDFAGGVVNTLTSLDATGSDKGVTVTLVANDDVKTSTFGDGADMVMVGVNKAAQTSNLGAGTDTVTIDAVAGAAAEKTLTVDVGAGDGVADIVKFASGGNVFDATEANFLKQLVTIDGFNAAQDLINAGGLGGTGAEAQNAVNAAASAAASLFDAVTAVAAVNENGNTSAQFTFDGDLYIFVDNDAGNDLSAGDTLIKVTGQGLLSGAALNGL